MTAKQYVTPYVCTNLGLINYNMSCPDHLVIPKDQLILNIIAAKETLDALPKIDAGNTWNLLDIVYNTKAPGQIKNKLLQAGPYLSDTVLLAVIQRPGKPALPPGIVKEIVVPNSPVTPVVKQALDTRVPAIPAGIMTEINDVQTGTSARQELEEDIAYYTEQHDFARNELLQQYIHDTTIVNGTDSLIAFLETQEDIPARQQLAQAYLYIGLCAEAQAVLDALPQETAGDAAFYTFYNMLAGKCAAGESIYDLSPAQEQLVRDLLNTGTITEASAEALLSLVYDEYFPPEFVPLIAPDSLNLSGTLSADSLCGGQLLANMTVYLINGDSTPAMCEPVKTDTQGVFSFTY
ncbi:MAG: hypothetical protein KJ607_10670, partial [Bacteroidetes bacterium]|nr:hypothetical protein [Bacteroidota bacterium]